MILVADDDLVVRTSLNLLLKDEGYRVLAVSLPDQVYEVIETEVVDLILLDMNFSLNTTGKEGLEAVQKLREINNQIPVILMTGWGTISLAVEGMKNGAADFITKPWDNQHLLQTIKTILNLNHHVRHPADQAKGRKHLDAVCGFASIIGESPRLVSVLKTVAQVSKADASVLITGESGTGKELIAEAIHNNSLRKNKPFVKVNLGGMSASLFESERRRLTAELEGRGNSPVLEICASN